MIANNVVELKKS